MPLEEGQKLMQELFEHMKQDKYQYVHYWESPGDFVIWDNAGVLHQATIGTYLDKYVRDLRRVSTLDSGPAAYGMNDLGRRGNRIGQKIQAIPVTVEISSYDIACSIT